MRDNTEVELSIVTTLYRSTTTLDEFHRRATAAARRLTPDYEFVYINDGSPDDSLERAVRICDDDPRTTVIDLSRNFGHHHAIMAGLRHARGRKVFLIDVDLEEDPEWLLDFDRRLEEGGHDVVYGVATARKGGAFKRWSGSLFYKVFNALSETAIPPNLCTVRLMRREYVDALLRLRDRSIFLAGLFAWAGFRQAPVLVEKKQAARPSTYNLRRLVLLMVRAITSFSAYPLQVIFFLGLGISALNGVLELALVVRKLIWPSTVLLGYASLMISLWFLSGIVIFCLGVIGIYVAAIYNEVKERPDFIVRRIYGGAARPGARDGPGVVVGDLTT